MQDELAEHTCPSPVYAGHEDAHDDYDPYDYFEDIAYLSDSHYDGKPITARPAKPVTNVEFMSKKRKMMAGTSSLPKKRRKSGRTTTVSTSAATPQEVWNVVWKAANERDEDVGLSLSGKQKTLSSFALLPGWRDLEEPTDDQGLPVVGATASSSVSDQTQPEPLSEEETEPPSGGVDIADLSSIAGLLSDDHMETLQELLKSKGLDPEAVQLVLQDLMSGHERSFESEEEEEEEEKEAEGGAEVTQEEKDES